MTATTVPALHHKTMIRDLVPGDVFAYQRTLRDNERLSPVVSVTDISGQLNAAGVGVYLEGMHRVRHEDSDDLGTLFYGDEVVFRASRK